MELHTPDTLNIFTDASIITTKYNERIGCAGAVAVLYGTDTPVITTSIIRNTTNNNSEITAILLGVIIALNNRSNNTTINLFSDSKICVLGLREWIYNWIKNRTSDGTMISSSGKPVANQEIFMQIINLITINKLEINLYHQKGHVNIMNSSDILNAKKVFNDSNHEYITEDDTKTISKFNDYIDKHTRSRLMTLRDSFGNVGINIKPEELKLIKPISRCINTTMVNDYSFLIKNK